MAGRANLERIFVCALAGAELLVARVNVARDQRRAVRVSAAITKVARPLRPPQAAPPRVSESPRPSAPALCRRDARTFRDDN